MRVNFDDTDVDDGLRVTYQGEWFTGEAIEVDRAGNIISLSAYINGREDGLSQEWYSDGTLRHSGMVKLGMAVGMHQEWYPNGQLISQREFDSGGDELARRRWDEAGNLIEEKIYHQ